ncbi:MAG: ATP-binding protein [Pseudohongiella sp.]|nr:ATP-binding protein [Pseudohongiella sp.]
MLRRLTLYLLLVLLISPAVAQSPQAVLFSKTLLSATADNSPHPSMLADMPLYQKHTGVLVLLPDPTDSDQLAESAFQHNALADLLSGSAEPGSGLFALTGNYAALQQILQQRELLFWQLPLWTLIINFCSAFVLLLLHNKQRDKSLYSWLITCALLGNMYFMQQLSSIDLSPLLINLCVCAWLYTLSRLSMLTQNQHQTRTVTVLVASAMGVHLLAAMANSPPLASVSTAIYSLVLLTLSMRGLLWRSHVVDKASTVLLAAVALVLVSVVADSVILLSGFSLASHPGMQLQLAPITQILSVLAALYFLVNQHADTQSELISLNTSLDQRVQSAGEELQTRYQQLLKDSLDASSMRERKRIYQSIHEDLSDKLLQLIYSANDKETADLARTALAELRDTRSLTPDHTRALEDVLADVRSELQQRCDQANMALNWQQEAQLQHVQLNARQSSALSRTLREAFSNLLKHAKADSVYVQFIAGQNARLSYHVRDNGTGLPTDYKPGRGLVNMRNRIRELGGTLSISTPASGGTELIFTLPLEQTESAQLSWTTTP